MRYQGTLPYCAIIPEVDGQQSDGVDSGKPLSMAQYTRLDNPDVSDLCSATEYNKESIYIYIQATRVGTIKLKMLLPNSQS